MHYMQSLGGADCLHYSVHFWGTPYVCSGSDLPGGWLGFNPPNDFLIPPSLHRFELLGVDGAENVAFLMIFSSATAAL